jgi:outer membrane receptor protein involved in Fe transport
LIEPGTLYGDRQHQVDLRLTKRLTIRRVRVQGNVDINNLFNSTAVQNLNFTYGASWLQPTLVQPGRALVLSTQLEF